MAVYFIYSHDGAAPDFEDLEYAPNLAVPRRELASRASTGRGRIHLTSRMTTCNPSQFYAHWAEDEWPPATPAARMYVWRRPAGQKPPTASEPAQELWTYSGNAETPHIHQTATT